MRDSNIIAIVYRFGPKVLPTIYVHPQTKAEPVKAPPSASLAYITSVFSLPTSPFSSIGLADISFYVI